MCSMSLSIALKANFSTRCICKDNVQFQKQIIDSCVPGLSKHSEFGLTSLFCKLRTANKCTKICTKALQCDVTKPNHQMSRYINNAKSRLTQLKAYPVIETQFNNAVFLHVNQCKAYS